MIINVLGKNFSEIICCKLILPYFCTPFEKMGVDSVAQLVEQYTFNVWALGSSPSGITEEKLRSDTELFVLTAEK